MKQSILVKTLIVGPIETNCYFVYREEAGGGVVIVDPGDEADKIIAALADMKREPAAVLLTHGHFDHILAVPELLEKWPELPVCMAEKETKLAADPALNSPFSPETHCSVRPTHSLGDGDSITYAGITFRMTETPGHTAGSCCYEVEDPVMPVLFSGDTMFRESWGRTDLPTGSYRDILGSLRLILTTFPENMRLLPGHGPSSDIRSEKTFYQHRGLKL